MNWYNKHIKIAGGPKINLTNADLQTIKELIEEGNSFRQIASLIGVSHTIINHLNKKYKWRDVKKERSDMDKTIADHYLLPPLGQGWSGWKIQQEYGVGDKTIKNILKRMGLFDHYRVLEDTHKLQRQRYIDNPELREQVSDRSKKLHEDNPEIARQTSIRQKRKFKDPLAREEMSRKMKQRAIDHPEIGRNYSEYKREWWANYPGGFDAWLNSFSPEKQKEIMKGMNRSQYVY